MNFPRSKLLGITSARLCFAEREECY